MNLAVRIPNSPVSEEPRDEGETEGANPIPKPSDGGDTSGGGQRGRKIDDED